MKTTPKRMLFGILAAGVFAGSIYWFWPSASPRPASEQRKHHSAAIQNPSGPASPPASPVVPEAPDAQAAQAATGESIATRTMYAAHAPLRAPEVADPDSTANRVILQTMVEKALGRQRDEEARP